VAHRRNKGPAKIGRDLVSKAQTDDGHKCKEDPTREETVRAQWADVSTGLAQVPPTGATASIPESPRTTINTAMGSRDAALAASVSRTAATTAAVGSMVAALVAATG